MFNKTKMTTALLLTSGVFAGSVNAAEVTLTDVVTHLVSKAATVTAHEISNSLTNSIANAGHSFNLIETGVETKVIITKATVSQDSEVSAE